MADLKQLDSEEFLSLETYRQDGSGVKTPVWFAREGDALFIWTLGNTFKVKRIRNNPNVKIAACKRFGDITGEWIPAVASVDESQAAVKNVERLLRNKVGFAFAVFRVIDWLRDRWKKSQRVAIKVSLP